MQKSHTAPDRRVDWHQIATAFYTTSRSFRSIAADAGVSHTAIAKHARRHGWRRPSHDGMMTNNASVSLLARAVEVQLATIDGVHERSRCFVAAMIQLGAEPSRIAAALSISEPALFAEFGGEIEFHAGRRRNAG